MLVGGLIAATAAITRSGAGQLDFLPAAGGAMITAIVLLGAIVKRRIPGIREQEGVTRRRFLGWAGVTAAAGAVAAVVGRVIATGADAVEAGAHRDQAALPAVDGTAHPGGRRPGYRGHLLADHTERHVLPDRHRLPGAGRRPRPLDAADHRDGRPAPRDHLG